ncbi:MAG: UDP-N-acetylmuramate dehydrogenase [Clostridium sp.]|nr:UDP-N-acetylmuramate dehydrogenase [Clostridium sp.]
MNILHRHSLLRHNTFGIEATADHFIEYDSVDDLRLTINHIRTHYPDDPLLHIGGGSNLLFLEDFHGVVLHSCIRGIEPIKQEDSYVDICVGAGEVWDEVVDHTLSRGWFGLENLSAIPGEIGASAVQNIGAYGVEAKDFIVRVCCVNLTTGEPRIFEADECHYAYRRSNFKTKWRGQYAVTHVILRLSTTFTPRLEYGGIRTALSAENIIAPTATDIRRTIIRLRDSKLPDPARLGNAGSFFVNPVVWRDAYEALTVQYGEVPHYDIDPGRVKIPAGWLIEQCGWKGRALGPAAVHDRQALVLVNRGNATGRDIVALSDAVRTDVKTRFGIDITPEVNFITSRPVMRLTFLGTGTSTGVPQIGCGCSVCRSSDPRDKRLRCSSLIEVGTTCLLIDCGPDFRQQMLRTDFKPLDAVLLTHEHADHVGGLDDLRPYSVFGNVDIYADSLTADHLEQRLPYCFQQKMYPGVPELCLHRVEPHAAFRIGDALITPIRVMHGRMPILGYRINNLAYITDMSTLPDSEHSLLHGIDTLVINGLRHTPHHSHQTIEEACAFAQAIQARHTYIIHVGHSISPHAFEETLLPESIHLAYDGLSITIRN